MIPFLLVAVISVGAWYLVKQTAVVFQAPSIWDKAEPTIGIVGGAGFAYAYQPYTQSFNDPLGMLALRSFQVGVSLMILALMLGVPAEEEGLLRTPDKLAPPKARFIEQVASVDELDDGALGEYT